MTRSRTTFNVQSIMGRTCGMFEFRNNSLDPLNTIKLFFVKKEGTSVTFIKHIIQTFQFGNNLMAIIIDIRKVLMTTSQCHI